MSDVRPDVTHLTAQLADARRERDEAQAILRRRDGDRRDEQREAQHRLRNFLSVMRAIIRRSCDEAEDVETYCAVLEGRLTTVMTVHAGIEGDRRLQTDLGGLIADELLRFGVPESDRVRLAGPAVCLKAAAAGLIALVVHERVSDFVVSGRSDEPDAVLSIDWTVSSTGPHILEIDWSERSSAAPRETSLWSSWLSQALQHQLSAEVTEEATPGHRSQRYRFHDDAFVLVSLDEAFD